MNDSRLWRVSKGAFSNERQTDDGCNVAIKYETLQIASACGVRSNHGVKWGLKPGSKGASTEPTFNHTVSSVIKVFPSEWYLVVLSALTAYVQAEHATFPGAWVLERWDNT